MCNGHRLLNVECDKNDPKIHAFSYALFQQIHKYLERYEGKPHRSSVLNRVEKSFKCENSLPNSIQEPYRQASGLHIQAKVLPSHAVEYASAMPKHVIILTARTQDHQPPGTLEAELRFGGEIF